MSKKILVIVESPGKTSKIAGFLGSGYMVKACVGIFRDLDPKSMSIDFDNNFEPQYIITKPDVVKNLKSAMKSASEVYLATDNDTEGHGMAQALLDVLKPKKYSRILFNEITKKAIKEGIKNGGQIDQNQVAAQKTRRIMDRLFGYMVSPIVNKKVGGKSAGRVQSATVRLVIDKENEINDFMEKNSDSSSFKVTGMIGELKVSLCGLETDPDIDDPYKGKPTHIKLYKEPSRGNLMKLPSEDSLRREPNTTKLINTFLRLCLKSDFVVHSITEKPATRSPPAPFTTSTLQQEANRKHSVPIDVTMRVAQKLYEGGYITYMRTDSVEISDGAHADIKKVIEEQFGTEYYCKHTFPNKNKSAQLAHECIRPVHLDLLELDPEEIDDELQIKLYKLIWNRTIASQMAPAKLNITIVQIDISKYENQSPFYYFQSQIEKIVFLGFMKVYTESVDDEVETDTTSNFKGKIPKVGSKLIMEEIVAKQEYLRPPIRFTQASLVKKLEEMGIGRPATYVNTIKTILDRSYVEVGNIPGIKKDITILKIHSENKVHVMEIDEVKSSILLGKETKKIIPTNLGKTVNTYLLENFTMLLDYQFTAKMEADMDAIAEGTKIWQNVVKKFYAKLNPLVEKVDMGPSLYASSARSLGLDSGRNEIVAVTTRNGPAVARTIGKKTYYANIPESEKIEEIDLETAIHLLDDSVKILGTYEGADLSIRKGKSGTYYISYGKKQYCPIPEEVDSTKLKLKHAIKLIDLNKEKSTNNVINRFEIKGATAILLKGKDTYPPYIQVIKGGVKKNYAIHRALKPEILTKDDVTKIISASKTKPKNSKTAKKVSKKTK
jgi:DNA topoisomerase-1